MARSCARPSELYRSGYHRPVVHPSTTQPNPIQPQPQPQLNHTSHGLHQRRCDRIVMSLDHSFVCKNESLKWYLPIQKPPPVDQQTVRLGQYACMHVRHTTTLVHLYGSVVNNAWYKSCSSPISSLTLATYVLPSLHDGDTMSMLNATHQTGGIGYWVLGIGYWVLGIGYWVLG
jgi:hypothetical protein